MNKIYDPFYYKKYGDLPKEIKQSLKILGLRFFEIEEVYKVYWGAHVVCLKSVPCTLKIENLIKAGLIHIDLYPTVKLVLHTEKAKTQRGLI